MTETNKEKYLRLQRIFNPTRLPFGDTDEDDGRDTPAE